MLLQRFVVIGRILQGVPKKRTFRIIILQADTSERSDSRRLDDDSESAFFSGHPVVHFFVSQYFNLRSELAATRKWGGDHLRRAAAFKSSGRSSFLTPTWLEASQVFGKSGFEFEEAGQVTCSRLPPADNGACPALQQEALCLPAPPYF